MNVRLKKSFSFTAGLVYEENFLINYYDFDLHMLTVTDDHREQNIAYDRMKSWINNVLDGSIIIHDQSPSLDTWTNTAARIIALPEEPVDQIMGVLLYLKLNSIMENRLVVTSVEVQSTQGDGMTYIHNAGENVGTYFSQDGWWVDLRPNWGYMRPKEDGKIVNLTRQIEWNDYGLDWAERSEEARDSVVFADFRKDENK